MQGAFYAGPMVTASSRNVRACFLTNRLVIGGVSRDRNKQINEVHHFLARLRGFRDLIELHSGVSEEGQP